MIAIVLALLVGTQQPQASATPSTPPATATVRGHVLGGDTSQPLRKAQVRAIQIDAAPGANAAQGRENRVVTTDSDGKYELRDLPAGRYNLTASKGGYVQISWGQVQPNEPGKPLEILSGQTVERVDFTLSRGAVITGRIVDEFGDPLSGVMVAAVRSQVVNGQRRMMPVGRSFSTDDLGEFRMYGVQPGQYYIQATWRRMGLVIDPNTPAQTGYPVTFFPGTTDVTNAQRFTIAAGQTVADLAMALSPTKTATISGSVVDGDGRPLGGMMLMVAQTGPAGMVNFANMLRPDGGFSFTLSPGDYTLRTMPLPGRKDIGSVNVTVGTEDIKDVRIIVSPPSTISGRVIVDPAQAQALPPSLMLFATPLVPAPMPGAQPSRIADDLSFELTAMVGRTRITAPNLPPTWTIRSVRVNAVDVIDDGLDVRPNENITGVEVELTNKLTSVSGLVTTAGGDAVKNYTVVFFPADAKRWAPGSRYLRMARPDQDGRFKITGLPPADYNVIAVERVDQGQNTDPEFLERIRPRASSFSLFEGETKTIDLKIQMY
jgi:protocatechuate 3,4-dioxygenase beta subunit